MRFSVAAQASAHTNKCILRPSWFLEDESAGENGRGDLRHPSISQTFLQAENEMCSSNLQWSQLSANQLVSPIPVQILEPRNPPAKVGQHSILHPSAPQGRCVRNAMECHHRILWDK